MEECIGRVIALVITSPVATELPVHSWKLDELLDLEARPFSTRLPGESRKIVARTVVVDAYVDRIVVGGNSYPFSDLRLPDDLIHLNREREALRTYSNSVDELPGYEAYLNASRRFCCALRAYFGSRTLVRLIYHPPNAYNAYAWEVTETVR